MIKSILSEAELDADHDGTEYSLIGQTTKELGKLLCKEVMKIWKGKINGSSFQHLYDSEKKEFNRTLL